MRAKAKRRVIATIHVLMRRPKWHNEVFARYDQKRLYAWAAEWQSALLKPIRPRIDPDLIPSELTRLSDRRLFGEMYKPHVTRSKYAGVSTL